MVDVNPEIFDNPTLGQAANGPFLDLIEAQMNEDRDAKIEGRMPQKLTRDNCYPGYVTPPKTPSFNIGISADVIIPPGSPDCSQVNGCEQ